LAFQTIQVFYNLHFLQEALKVQTRQLDALTIALDQTKELRENGEATGFEVLTTEVKIAAAENTNADLENDLAIAYLQLGRLTGIQNLKKISIVNEWLETSAPMLLPSQNIVEDRPELKIAQLQEESAALSETLASKQTRPELLASINAGYKNGIAPDIDEVRLNFLAAAQLTVPIFTGYRNKYCIEEAKANRLLAEYHRKNITENLVTEVEQIHQNLMNAYGKIERTELQVKQAQEAADLARLKYKNEVITNLDLLDTEIALSSAEINLLNVIFDYTLLNYQLKKALGIDLY
ncbi:TolC family protein, partial [Saprospiraceae bacterium]|nr:TolC family protein [Saprospiraceae bacterium]